MCSLRLSASIALRQVHKAQLRHFFGETIGDIPLYSLHRIRNLMGRYPIAVSKELQTLFVEALLAANAEYKADSGNDWNCLTSNNLIDAIEATDKGLALTVKGICLPKEQEGVRVKLLERLEQARAQSVLTIQQWFETHYDNLLYNTGGNVPWPVVCRLRRNLGFWIATKGNRFGDDIEEVILDIAKEQGIETDNPEIAWEEMGGKLFHKDS